MARFQVGDVPSATLIDEANDPRQIAETVQALIDQKASNILDDLSLSEGK